MSQASSMILTMEAGCGRKELHEQTMLGDIGETREAGGGAEEERDEEEAEREEEKAEEGEEEEEEERRKGR